MGFIDVSELSYSIGGDQLFHDVSFRVGEGSKVALVGANGTGKTTLLRLIAGDIRPKSGTISNSGGIGVMRQFIGSAGGATTVRDFLLGLAPKPIRVAGDAFRRRETAIADQPDNADVAITYAQAVADWSSAGGYEAEVTWNVCCESSIGQTLEAVRDRLVATLSGGEQKRLALKVLLRGDEEVLLLDEPDNYLDVAAKRELKKALRATRPRPCSMSATTARCWPRPRIGWSPSRATAPGCTAAAARRLFGGPRSTSGAARRAAPGVGRRSTTTSRTWYAGCASRPR